MLTVTTLWLALAGAPAAQIYKCQLPSGVLSFQAKPCPRGTHLKTLVVPTQPETRTVTPTSAGARPAAIPPVSAPAAASDTRPPPPAAAPAPALAALPVAAYYRCTRHDGSSYYSASAYPRRQRVGVGALSDPTLAKSQPEQGMVWVEDQCSEVSLREACDWYEQQAAYIAAQQRVHSGLELKKLVQEYQRLSTIRRARCLPP